MSRLFFYELHEGATDLLTDAVLVSEQEFSPEAFEAMVVAARAAVIDTPKGSYFVKLTGPEKTVAHWDQAYADYLKSFEFK